MLPLPQPGFNIVLYQPEIPANTGNIGRLCVGTGSRLHIIQPCRFLLDDKSLRRAGLDYWPELQLSQFRDVESCLAQFPATRVFFCTTKCERSYWEPQYQDGDAFVFGPESRGLPDSLLVSHTNQLITIPMHPLCRSLNLSNSVAVVLYEAVRQVMASADSAPSP